MCIGVKTLVITPGSPWENGYKESFNAKLRDELLKGEIFTSLRDAQTLIARWQKLPMPSGRPRLSAINPDSGNDLAASCYPDFSSA